LPWSTAPDVVDGDRVAFLGGRASAGDQVGGLQRRRAGVFGTVNGRSFESGPLLASTRWQSSRCWSSSTLRYSSRSATARSAAGGGPSRSCSTRPHRQSDRRLASGNDWVSVRMVGSYRFSGREAPEAVVADRVECRTGSSWARRLFDREPHDPATSAVAGGASHQASSSSTSFGAGGAQRRGRIGDQRLINRGRLKTRRRERLVVAGADLVRRGRCSGARPPAGQLVSRDQCRSTRVARGRHVRGSAFCVSQAARSTQRAGRGRGGVRSPRRRSSRARRRARRPCRAQRSARAAARLARRGVVARRDNRLAGRPPVADMRGARSGRRAFRSAQPSSVWALAWRSGVKPRLT